MLTVLVHKDGVTRPADAVDPGWLEAGAAEQVWVNIEGPTEADRPLLEDVFHFHELAVDDAMERRHHPKVESYEGFLYLILHEVVPYEQLQEARTQDIDFFLGRNLLVTVQTGPSPAISLQLTLCARHHDVLAEGPVALLHRIVDDMVDGYRPSVDILEARLEAIERTVFDDPSVNPLREILGLKAEVASLRRIALPERDAVARLARREFSEIPEQMAYRFRDVYDQLVRVADEVAFFQDRVTGLLDAYLSMQSNHLNQVMKVLTLISTIFMPLTVLTGMYGMNVPLPHLPGGEGAQFWWIVAVILAVALGMLWVFRRMRWL
jgi:magnesium transporter